MDLVFRRVIAFAILLQISHALVEFTGSKLYDEFDFTVQNVQLNGFCSITGCRIYASLPESSNEIAKNILVHDYSHDDTSLYDVSQKTFYEQKGFYRVEDGPRDLVLQNRNRCVSNQCKTAPMAVWVVQEGTDTINTVVFDAENLNKPVRQPEWKVDNNSVVTVMSAEPFTLRTKTEGQTVLVAALAGFDTFVNFNDGCTFVLEQLDPDSNSDIEVNVQSPLISIYYGDDKYPNSTTSIAADVGNGILEFSGISFAASPGFIGCNGGQMYRSTLYSETTSIKYSNDDLVYDVNVTSTAMNTDGTHPVTVTDYTNGLVYNLYGSPDYGTTADIFLEQTKNLEISWTRDDNDPGQYFLVRITPNERISTTTGLETTSVSTTELPLTSTETAEPTTTVEFKPSNYPESVIEFTNSKLFGEFDFAQDMIISDTFCEIGCRIYASVPESSTEIAKQIIVRDYSSHDISIYEISTLKNGDEKIYFDVAFGNIRVDILNLNPDYATAPMVVWIVQMTADNSQNSIVYEAANLNTVKPLPQQDVRSYGVVTVMSAEPFTLRTKTEGQTVLFAALTGFDTFLRDGCTNVLEQFNSDANSDIEAFVTSPLFSIYYDVDDYPDANISIVADVGNGKLDFSGISFAASPGFIGCNGGQMFRSSLYTETTSFGYQADIAYNVAITSQAMNTDAAHPLTITDNTHSKVYNWSGTPGDGSTIDDLILQSNSLQISWTRDDNDPDKCFLVRITPSETIYSTTMSETTSEPTTQSTSEPSTKSSLSSTTEPLPELSTTDLTTFDSTTTMSETTSETTTEVVQTTTETTTDSTSTEYSASTSTEPILDLSTSDSTTTEFKTTEPSTDQSTTFITSTESLPDQTTTELFPSSTTTESSVDSTTTSSLYDSTTTDSTTDLTSTITFYPSSSSSTTEPDLISTASLDTTSTTDVTTDTSTISIQTSTESTTDFITTTSPLPLSTTTESDLDRTTTDLFPDLTTSDLSSTSSYPDITSTVFTTDQTSTESTSSSSTTVSLTDSTTTSPIEYTSTDRTTTELLTDQSTTESTTNPSTTDITIYLTTSESSLRSSTTELSPDTTTDSTSSHTTTELSTTSVTSTDSRIDHTTIQFHDQTISEVSIDSTTPESFTTSSTETDGTVGTTKKGTTQRLSTTTGHPKYISQSSKKPQYPATTTTRRSPTTSETAGYGMTAASLLLASVILL